MTSGLMTMAMAYAQPRDAGDVERWLGGFAAGVHVLADVPAAGQVLPTALPKGVPRRGGLGSWQGAAFAGPTYTFGVGGHDDGYFDGLARVNFITGEAVVSKASPLTRAKRFQTAKMASARTVMVPERDDYVTRHIAGAIVEVAPGILQIMGYSGAGCNSYEKAAGLPSAWVVNLNQTDTDGYALRHPMAFQPVSGGNGWKAAISGVLLPDGKVFWAAISRWFITDGEKLVSGRRQDSGWSAAYMAKRNSVIAIAYSGAIRELSLKADFSGVVATKTVAPSTKNWLYSSSIAPWSDHEVIIFTGAANNYLIDLDSGAQRPIKNRVFVEPRLANRSFNRLHRLAEGAYIYLPTDMNAHPVLWIVK